MAFKTAKQIIKHYFICDADFDELMIDLMGGEPMLAFPLIQRLVEYVTNRQWNKRYHFSMSTNGTLFDEENKAWFIKYRKVLTPMLSFDGTKVAHDLNRSQSYGKVLPNIHFFRKYWPFQHVKMTVNDKSLPYLTDGILSILALDCDVDLNLVHENVWGEGEQKQRHLRVLEYELARLVDFYTEFPRLEPPMLVSLPIAHCLSPGLDRFRPWCGAGDAMIAIDKNGIRYPCHRFMKISAGKSMTLEEFQSLKKKPRESFPCHHCAMIPACPTCQGCNWEYNASTVNRVTYNCDMLKLQMVATGAIHLNRINRILAKTKLGKIDKHKLAEMARQLEAVRLTFRVLADLPQAELKPYITGDWPNGKGWKNRIRWYESKN